MDAAAQSLFRCLEQMPDPRVEQKGMALSSAGGGSARN